MLESATTGVRLDQTSCMALARAACTSAGLDCLCESIIASGYQFNNVPASWETLDKHRLHISIDRSASQRLFS
jgi:hypothetical protein